MGAKYTLWVLFSMVFILFSVGFVNVVSPNAIGKFAGIVLACHYFPQRIWYSRNENSSKGHQSQRIPIHQDPNLEERKLMSFIMLLNSSVDYRLVW